MSTIAKVLWIASNPIGTNPLRLMSEAKAINDALESSEICLSMCLAATVHDVQRALMREPYQIVHISASGAVNGCLELDDSSGKRYFVPQQALADEFKAYRAAIHCVVLNACYSASQGKLISMGVPITIAMDGLLGEKAAIEFSRMFYAAIAAGHPVEFAYERGCNAVELARGKEFRPLLLRNLGAEEDGAVPTATIVVRVESKTGEGADLQIAQNAQLEVLAKAAQGALGVSEEAVAGRLRGFSLAWVMVDTHAEPQFLKLQRPEQQRLRAFVKTPDGVRPTYNLSDSVFSAGIRDGMIFRMYAVENVGRAALAAPLAARPVSRIPPAPVRPTFRPKR